MPRNEPPSPSRMVDDRHEPGCGDLLNQADQAFRAGLSETDAWERLQQYQRKRVERIGIAIAAAALAVTVVVAVVHGGAPPPALAPEAPLLAEPEPLRLTPTKPSAPPALPAPLPPLVVEPPKAPELRADGQLEPAVPAAPPRRAAPRTEAECKALSKSSPAHAEECLVELSAGHGSAAEVALLELARLRTGLLAQPVAALQTLDRYRERFPNGALRGEAELARLHALSALGRHREALQESSNLLSTMWGRSASAELHYLRGKIYLHELQDCAAAASEFVSLVGEPGAHADEAEFERAVCLEQLGRVESARDAYRRYLQRPSARRAERARDRLSRIEAAVAAPASESRRDAAATPAP